MTVTLATIFHDPENRLHAQLWRVMPQLREMFDGLAVWLSSATPAAHREYLSSLDARVKQDGHLKIGYGRRACIELALTLDNPFIVYCDGDRILHWAEQYPDELSQVARQVRQYDFTVLGRTPRAFDTHPRVQRDTERIINHVFEKVSGCAWDVSAGARALSRQTAEAIVQGNQDNEASTDVSWTLLLRRAGQFKLGYLEFEGLEFETPDRYPAEVAQAGGPAQWAAQLDADPRRWAQRLDLARREVEAMIPFTPSGMPSSP